MTHKLYRLLCLLGFHVERFYGPLVQSPEGPLQQVQCACRKRTFYKNRSGEVVEWEPNGI